MLTRTMPSVMRALQKSLDSQTLKAFSQAIGNCNQPLEHRGEISVYPQNPFVRQGEYEASDERPVSTREFAPYNPAYLNLFQPVFGNFNPVFPEPFRPAPILPPNLTPGSGFVDGGGGGGGGIGPINNNFYPTSFSFPTDLNFPFPFGGGGAGGGGGGNYFGGDTNFDTSITRNSYTDNSVTNNISTGTINGRPVQGPAGPPGEPGTNGRDGAPGAPGFSGQPGGGVFVPVPFPLPNAPPPPEPPTDSFISGTQPKVQYPGHSTTVDVKSYSFDPATCTLTETVTPVDIEIPAAELPLEDFQIKKAYVPRRRA